LEVFSLRPFGKQRSGGSWFKASPRQIVWRPNLEKTQHRNGLVEWLKEKALSSSPSTAKKEKAKAKQ
jgi:hypothetical protein